MAKNSNDKTVISEAYLSKFAKKQLQTFLDTENEPFMQRILAYIPSAEGSAPSGSTDLYVTVSPGNTNVMLQAGGLKNATANSRKIFNSTSPHSSRSPKRCTRIYSTWSRSSARPRMMRPSQLTRCRLSSATSGNRPRRLRTHSPAEAALGPVPAAIRRGSRTIAAADRSLPQILGCRRELGRDSGRG